MPRKVLQANLVGPQIAKARTRMGFTQEEFAAHCQLAGLDISRSTLAQIESRLRYVCDTELIVLASLLNTTLDDLFPEGIKKKLRSKRIPSAQGARRAKG